MWRNNLYVVNFHFVIYRIASNSKLAWKKVIYFNDFIEPEFIRQLKKDFFATETFGDPGQFLVDGEKIIFCSSWVGDGCKTTWDSNLNGGLQTKWFSKFFSKKICIIHFDKHQILSRMVVIWNHQSHVVALESKSYWKFVNHFTAHLRTIWRHHGYQNDPLLVVRVLTEPDFRYRKYFRFYSKIHFSIFRHQQNVFVLS